MTQTRTVVTHTRANVALISVFAALIAVSALIPGFMIGPVPFVMTIVIVLLAPMILGTRDGLLANLLYVVAGAAGLPIFSGGASGFGVLAGPTGGYLVGYVVAPLVAGPIATFVLRRWPVGLGGLLGLAVAGLGGLAGIHAVGVAGLMINAGMGLNAALVTTAGFVGFDLIKVAVAAVLALAIVRAFPRLLAAR
ncbi:biotin transporter BioY [Ancrocorticia populi]|uniref:Biotin transporter n=1 Tax=Ancrocorticia populi TaxID=2175228 RepID=A0A2V1K3K6_9ACTO|nr:biotin transporter BioY [Ancrocorticia populi]PWF25651.1 biotin transporter BioY [Ancrocorticia populi]